MARSSEVWWMTGDGRRVRLDRLSDEELHDAQLHLLAAPLELPGNMALYDAVAVELKVRSALRHARHPERPGDLHAA